MRTALVAHAPTRLDFGGGWTDVPPYPEERGGFVCSIAIDLRAFVRLAPYDAHQDAHEQYGASALARTACQAANVRNARVTLTSNFPVGAGLGGSSAAGVALAAALAAWNGQTMDASALAEWSRAVEVSGMQIAGGRQDHYAAAHGGALALTFGKTVDVRSLSLTDDTIRALEQRCVLLYTGESRLSGETITAVLDAYKERNARVVEALERMAILARQMANAIEGDDVEALSAHVDEHWHHQRALHPRITTERIDAIQRAARDAGATGLKALGASGGGCVLIFAPAHEADRVANAVAHLGERLAWRVARKGVQVEEGEPLPIGRAAE